jgi:PAS domain S-box-containing protein
MNELLNVLCLEDSPRDVEIMRELLIDAGYNLNMDCTASEEEYVSLLRSHKYDFILADFKLPGFDGFTALQWSVEICPDVPFICISGTIGEETAVELLKKGAVDYIMKDRLIRLPSAIQRAIEQHNIQIEKRAAELLLKENEEKLQSIFSTAPVGIGLVVGRIFIEVNDTFCRMTGYNRSELIGKDAETLYAKDEQNESAGFVIYRHIAEKGTGSVETRFKCKDGRVLNIFLSSTPLDKDDLSKGVTFIAMNITERKLAEEKLIIANRELVFQNDEKEKRAAEYKDIYDNAIEGMFRTSLEGKSLQSNKALAKMLGYDTADNVVNSVTDSGHQVWANADERLKYAKILEEQDIIQKYECQYKRVDGGIIWVSLNSRLVHDENGKALYYEGFVEDITERKQTEFELIKAKEKAEESDRLKSAFLTNMSHEIRTPMNGILGFTELLKEPNLSSDDQQDFIQIIQVSGVRMLNTINNIVDISKIESGLMKVDIKETNINEKMEFTYKFFKPEAEIKGLQFLFKSSLPAKEAIIKTDNEKVYGILTNLVKNAIKFTYEGSIEFGYEKKGKYLEFFVKDTGAGIPQNQQQIIFERFRQGSDSLTRKYEGSGLGLSIAKSYVEMLGGKIWVESEEGKGSTFYFTIPYNAVSEEKHTIENVISAENKDVQLRNLKTLIVEDDEISYSLLIRTVQKISTEVLHAITGFEAVEACRNNPDLDLVLMDIRMPKMDGLEATRQIRQFNKDVIIIAQTAYGFSSDSEKALKAGCNDYISKPISKTLLYELIKKHIN